MLEALVTDVFLATDGKWTKLLTSLLPSHFLETLRRRAHPALASGQVKCCLLSGLLVIVLDKLPRVPFATRRFATRHADAILGGAAGELATRRGAGLVSYSYYAHAALSRFRGHGILFQLHPHPRSMRRILTEEMAAHPDCAESLSQEWELSLPEEDFERLAEEPTLAKHILCASSFTRRTLIENGVVPGSIRVLPYGVDLYRFCPALDRRLDLKSKLKLLFVGRINQRKGVKYLIEALRLLDTSQVELTICGRVVDSLELFKPYADFITIRPSVSHLELLRAYQEADLFVLPSVAEGFGQVLLEALACGLPILSTTHTAAPDLIEDGAQGFIVDPRDPAMLADRIKWALTHRAELAAMRSAARLRAEYFTWDRFRSGVVAAIRSCQLPHEQPHPHPQEATYTYV